MRMRGGLDIIRREASWVLQALDPVTGKTHPLIPHLLQNALNLASANLCFDHKNI